MMRTCAVVFVCALAAACSSGGGGPDAAQQHLPVCGDSVCEPAEVSSCMQDCGGGHANAVCGNNQCEQGETAQSCPGDCGPKCGDTVCDMAGGENASNCPSDCMMGSGGGGTCPANNQDCLLCALFGQLCPNGLDQAGCFACFIAGGGGAGCMGGMPNGTCDPGEDSTNCPLDCP